MAGLALLKRMYDPSDEALCDRWIENPYFQFFCGEEFFQLMTRVRFPSPAPPLISNTCVPIDVSHAALKRRLGNVWGNKHRILISSAIGNVIIARVPIGPTKVEN
jgi:hypothetical protein